MTKLVVASDGLVGRKVGKWNDEKLKYIRDYVTIFATGMKDQWAGKLGYADFFCGSGVCIGQGQVESQGSPLIAAAREEFSALLFNDLSADAIDALGARLSESARARAVLSQQDCNDAIDLARQHLFPNGVCNGLALAVIDPYGFEMEFESIERLTRDNARIDLLITVMSGYAQRFLGTPAFHPESKFDRFMGQPDWNVLKATPRSLRTRAVLDEFGARLRGIGYVVDDSVTISNSRSRSIYQLVDASRNERGLDFWRKARDSGKNRQRRLFG